MYECPSCSAGLRFDLEKQLVECNYCGNEYNVEDIKNRRT